jgi:4-carboxymuconolactone decarboxylase
MARMKQMTPEEFDPQVRALGEKIAKTRGGSIQGPWAHMLRVPKLAEKAAAYSDLFRTELSLPLNVVQLAVIMAARHWNAEYVWNAQSPRAKEAGVSEAAIEAIRTKKPATFTDPKEKAVYDLFSELYSKQGVSDATYDAAVKALGEKGLVEVINVNGFYGIVATIVRTTGIPTRDGAHPFGLQ